MVYDYKLHLVIRTPWACPWEQSVTDQYYPGKIHRCGAARYCGKYLLCNYSADSDAGLQSTADRIRDQDSGIQVPYEYL